MMMILLTYKSTKLISQYSTLLVGIGVGVITVRCLHILLESMGEERKIPWKSIRTHVLAIIILLLAYGGLINMIKGYFI